MSISVNTELPTGPRIALVVTALLALVSTTSPHRLQAQIAKEARAPIAFTDQDTIRVLHADPRSRDFLNAFERYFPERYLTMVRAATLALKRGAGPEEGRRIGLATVRAFVAENVRNIAFASTPSLVSYTQAQVRLFEIMQRDNVTTCALYSMGIFRKGGSGPNSLAIGDATSSLAIIMMQAAREGIDHPTDRIFQVLTTSEQTNFSAALIRQLESKPALLRIAIDPEKLQSASPIDQCALGMANAKAIASLPDDLAAKIVAKTLTGS